MKKIVSVLLVVMSICMLAGCSGGLSDSQYVGTYQMVGAKMNGVELTKEELDQTGAKATIVLNGDASVTMTVNEQTTTGTWKESDNGVTISYEDGSDPAEFTMKDGMLTGTANGMEMSFQKQ